MEFGQPDARGDGLQMSAWFVWCVGLYGIMLVGKSGPEDIGAAFALLMACLEWAKQADLRKNK